MVEDESDVLAAKELRAEVHADIAEFSEEAAPAGSEATNQEGNEADDAQKFRERQSNDMNKLENEFKLIETEVWTTTLSNFLYFSWVIYPQTLRS